MKSNYKKLGDYIRLVDERNKDDRVTRLLGVSIEKKFIESIANTVGTDMSVYKIVRKGQFAYGPVTSRNGDKVSIALLQEEECIISSSYTVFEIIDTTKLLPEYLNLWFKRPEFDRYARFHSHGSAREIFDWDEMCNVELPIPELDEQKKIVEAYSIIEKRIEIKRQINDNLEAQAQAIFKNIYKEPGSSQTITLDKVFSFIKGKKPIDTSFTPKDLYQPYLNIDCLTYGEKVYACPTKMIMADDNDFLMVMDGASSGKVYYGMSGVVASTLAKLDFILPEYKELTLQLLYFKWEEISTHNTGSAIPHTDKDFIYEMKLAIPDNLNQVNTALYNFRQQITLNLREIAQLKILQSSLIITVSR